MHFVIYNAAATYLVNLEYHNAHFEMTLNSVNNLELWYYS